MSQRAILISRSFWKNPKNFKLASSNHGHRVANTRDSFSMSRRLIFKQKSLSPTDSTRLQRCFVNLCHWHLLNSKRILKQYPEIGDRPKKVLSNPPDGSIEALKGFYRTLVRGTSEPQTRFYRTFRIERPPFFGYCYAFKILPNDIEMSTNLVLTKFGSPTPSPQGGMEIV